jgi:hypothetical protein
VTLWRLLALISLSAFTLVPRSAFADSASNKAAAEALFEQGRALLEQGRTEAACESFEASQRLDSGLGTLLYLADCYEQVGRTASAWATFREAGSLARGRGDGARADIALERADSLEPRLSKLWLKVSSGASTEMTITRNGTPIPKETWSLAIPVDPGTHEIVASAPNKETWSTKVSVEGEASTLTVTVPPLAPARSGGAGDRIQGSDDAARTEDTGTADGSTQRTVGLVVGGAGVVGVVLGSVFGLNAMSKNDESLDHCDPRDPSRCTQTGKDLRDAAGRSAMVSNVAFGLGGAAVVTGVVLYLTAPSEEADTAFVSGVHLRSQVSSHHTGLSLQGAW